MKKQDNADAPLYIAGHPRVKSIVVEKSGNPKKFFAHIPETQGILGSAWGKPFAHPTNSPVTQRPTTSHPTQPVALRLAAMREIW